MSTLDDAAAVAAELREVHAEQVRLSTDLGGTPAKVDHSTGEIIRPAVIGLEGRWRRARLEAHTASTVKHGRKWTADQHNNAADTASFSEWADWNAAQYALKAVRDRAHSLRQEMFNLMGSAKIEADLSR